MITKTVEPIISAPFIDQEGLDKVIGVSVEYRVFGIRVYRKTIHSPAKYGEKNWRSDIYMCKV